MVFVLKSTSWCIRMIDFLYVEPTMHFGDRPHFLHFFEDFSVDIHKRYLSVCSFL